jgi:deoxyribodipyrimidine photo-lyase
MTRSVKASLVWFRQDLRLSDNPALLAATARGGPVVPLYIGSPEEDGEWPPGAASRWWLQRSLAALASDLESRGSRLILRAGASLAALRELAAETGAQAVFWSRRYEPAAVERDRQVEAALTRGGIEVHHYNASLLFEPHEVRTRSGGPFRVFTPFWTACRRGPAPPPPQPAPARLVAPARWPASLPLSDLGLEPRFDWAAGLRAAWRPGEAGAAAELERLVEEALAGYPEQRDRPGRTGTSRLSPHLHHGEIGPRQIWQAVCRGRAGSSSVAGSFLRQLGWREFAFHLLRHFPHSPDRPLRPAFASFPWARDRRALRAWQRGRTGYPIVDAGMRELWKTGWMHNRARMIAASFLVKDLLLSWNVGARWFWDTLVDADLANNTLGWQWVAGCGADAAPFFRVFNPAAQGARFDTRGEYVRRWVPEISGLPDRWIHHPSAAPAEVLRKAGVELGKTYPLPIVDHAAARRRALAALRVSSKVVRRGLRAGRSGAGLRREPGGRGERGGTAPPGRLTGRARRTG